jgi:hypothetical protein
MRLDLSPLSPEQFEDLIEAIFRARMPEPVISVERSGRGADRGMDLTVRTLVSDGIAFRETKWLVQCKHKAKSAKAVSPGDFKQDFTFPDILAHHNASDFLLVCSTQPSINLQSLFARLTEDKHPHQFIIWNGARVCQEVLDREPLVQRFFPEVYDYQRGLVSREALKQWAEEQRLPKGLQKALKTLVRTENYILAMKSPFSDDAAPISS